MDVKFLINTARYFDHIPHPHNFELCTNVSYMQVHAFGLFSTQNHLNEKFWDYFSFTSLTIRTDPRSFPTSSIMPTPPSLTSPFRTLTQATIPLPGGAQRLSYQVQTRSPSKCPLKPKSLQMMSTLLEFSRYSYIFTFVQV